MVTRKAFVRPIIRRVPHFSRRSETCQAHRPGWCSPLVWKTDPRSATHAAAASSRGKSWRKKCRPHKN